MMNIKIYPIIDNDLTNYSTDFVPNGDMLIIWKAESGKCDFCMSEYWYDIDEEWNWFISVLKSYNPLDYDEINNTYI